MILFDTKKEIKIIPKRAKLKIIKKNIICDNYTNFIDYINILIKKAHDYIDNDYDNDYNINNEIDEDLFDNAIISVLPEADKKDDNF